MSSRWVRQVHLLIIDAGGSTLNAPNVFRELFRAHEEDGMTVDPVKSELQVDDIAVRVSLLSWATPFSSFAEFVMRCSDLVRRLENIFDGFIVMNMAASERAALVSALANLRVTVVPVMGRQAGEEAVVASSLWAAIRAVARVSDKK